MKLTVTALCAALVLSTPWAEAKSPEVKSLRVYAFDCGTVTVSDLSVFNGVDKGKEKVLTDSCYLVAHPKGTLMWDTGFNDKVAAMPDGVKINAVFHARLKKSLADQFKSIGYSMDDVTYLGISHMHFDHTGNVGLFPKATLLMQKEEYEAALGPDAAKFGNNPQNYPTLGGNPAKQLTGDHDVFGDGSVIIKRTLGHSPGHQSLFLKLPKTGNVLLSGDMVHFTDNWEKRRVPGMNFNKELSAKTMEEMDAFMKANKATLWIQHDLEQNAALPRAPHFFE
jgi:glyoxylase-like metal-dependent hydrolase (beta-lactamase superfamily II)